jgi:hypothetical protein
VCPDKNFITRFLNIRGHTFYIKWQKKIVSQIKVGVVEEVFIGLPMVDWCASGAYLSGFSGLRPHTPPVAWI